MEKPLEDYNQILLGGFLRDWGELELWLSTLMFYISLIFSHGNYVLYLKFRKSNNDEQFKRKVKKLPALSICWRWPALAVSSSGSQTPSSRRECESSYVSLRMELKMHSSQNGIESSKVQFINGSNCTLIWLTENTF